MSDDELEVERVEIDDQECQAVLAHDGVAERAAEHERQDAYQRPEQTEGKAHAGIAAPVDHVVEIAEDGEEPESEMDIEQAEMGVDAGERLVCAAHDVGMQPGDG